MPQDNEEIVDLEIDTIMKMPKLILNSTYHEKMTEQL